MVAGPIMIRGAEVAVVAEAAVVEEVMEMAGEVKVMVAEWNILKATVIVAEFGATRKLIVGTSLKTHICVKLITNLCRIMKEMKPQGLASKLYFRTSRWIPRRNSTVP